jgi:hypothetical protein
MDTVCKNIDLSRLNVSALTNGTILDSTTSFSANSFQGLPSYDPSNMPGYSYTIGTNTYTAKIFSILKYAPANRYTLPTGSDEYWSSARNSNLDTAGMLSTFNATNVDGKTYKIITPKEELAAALTGSVNAQKTAVSYDFLYSLQFEFCFWAKLYRIMIGDFIRVQNAPTSDSGFSTIAKNSLLRQLVNALNSVNLRLTDLTKIAQAVADAQRTGLADMNTQVNQFLTSISNNVDSLEKNRKDLTSSDVASRLKARMLEYTDEKNAYANQMLAMYGFANLIAVGLLFYIYRS